MIAEEKHIQSRTSQEIGKNISFAFSICSDRRHETEDKQKPKTLMQMSVLHSSDVVYNVMHFS